MKPKCGFCKADIVWTHYVRSVSKVFMGNEYITAMHCCPNCDAVLSVEVDQGNLIAELKTAIRKGNP